MEISLLEVDIERVRRPQRGRQQEHPKTTATDRRTTPLAIGRLHLRGCAVAFGVHRVVHDIACADISAEEPLNLRQPPSAGTSRRNALLDRTDNPANTSAGSLSIALDAARVYQSGDHRS